MKWFGWLVKTAISSAIITAVSVTVTWSMVNIYVQQLLKPLQGDQSAKPIALTDLISFFAGSGTVEGTETGVEAETETAVEAGASEDTPADAETTPAQPGTNQSPYHTPDEPASESPPPDNALPVMGSAQEDEMFLSTDELDAKKDSITSEDRMEIFMLLMEKLPPEEMQNISKLLEGGITAEEMQEAGTILQKHLNQEEYDRLIAILTKY